KAKDDAERLAVHARNYDTHPRLRRIVEGPGKRVATAIGIGGARQLAVRDQNRNRLSTKEPHGPRLVLVGHTRLVRTRSRVTPPPRRAQRQAKGSPPCTVMRNRANAP